MIQPVEQLVGQPVKCLYTRYSWWSNQLSNVLFYRFDSWLYRVNGVLHLL